MKKVFSLFMALLMVVALSACAATGGNDKLPANSDTPTDLYDTLSRTDTSPSEKTPTDASISRDRAIEIALNKAGVSRDAVWELEAELDKEINGTFWEVDFETREFEYSYDINANTGEVVREQKEYND